jgi:hypothetical protein
MLWAIVAVWLLLMVPAVFFMLQHTVLSIFGSTS